MLTSKFVQEPIKGSNKRILLVGAQNTGKTSLAFRLAYEIAEGGGSPLFICNQAKMESKLPLELKCLTDSSELNRMSPDILSRMQMKYVTSMNELKAVISGLHCFQPPPSAVIIDDLSLLIDPLHSVPRNDPKFLDICLSLGAYIDDVLNFIESRNHPPSRLPNSTSGVTGSSSHTTHEKRPKSLQLVITDSCEDAPFLHIMLKTVHTIAKIGKSPLGDHVSVMSLGNSVVKARNSESNNNRQILVPKIEFTDGYLLVNP